MKADEKNLEKQLKRVIRSEFADAALFEANWRSLGRSADYTVIRQLNRLGGWGKFLLWTSEHAGLRDLIERLASAPGISEAGLEGLKQRNYSQKSGSDAAREAVQISKDIEQGSANPQILSERFKADDTLFEGVLLLLESSNSKSASKFLHSLLDQNPSKGQESKIRKLLYLFRQKGIRPQIEAHKTQIDRELFFFGENRLALWQPVLYFNPHSPFSATGDLLILRILEGSECASPEQQPNLALNQTSMSQIAERYSAQLEKQLGLQMKFQSVSPPVARYLLHASAELMSETVRAKPLIDFLKFIGSDRVENPFEKLPEVSATEIMNADLMLHDPYFAHWMLNPHDVDKYLEQVTQLEKGPIILTGGPRMTRQHELKLDFLSKIFTARERMIWAFAFRKAAFYLRDSNPAFSGTAMFYAKQLENIDVPVDNLEVARALFDRAVTVAQTQQKAKEEDERKTSLILTPDQLRKRS